MKIAVLILQILFFASPLLAQSFNYSGTYRYNESELRIVEIAGRDIDFEIAVSWQYDGPPHFVYLCGSAPTQKNTSIWSSPKNNNCKIKMKFHSDKAQVIQEGSMEDCGYPESVNRGVRLDGLYKKISSKEPRLAKCEK